MLKGLTRAGIGDVGDDRTFIERAAVYGFQAVDMDPRGLVEEIGIEGTKSLLEANAIQIGSLSLPVDWQSDDETFREGLTEVAQVGEIGQALGATACTTFILPSRDLPTALYTIKATKRLQLCADILAAYDIRLGLEFVGPHHLRTEWIYPFIWRMEDTLEWIDLIGSPNFGLLLDSYHWYTNELDTDAILALDPRDIIHVHINDAPDVPVEDVHDFNRLYPGEGVIDLVGFLRSLKKIGYEGVVSQEVMGPVTEDQSSDELLERSKQAFAQLFSQI